MDLQELKTKHPDVYKAAVGEGQILGRAEGKTIGIEEGKAIGLAQGKEEGLAAGRAEGANSERSRIQAIEAISVPGGEAIVAAEKFKPEATAATVSLQILAKQKAEIGGRATDAAALAAAAKSLGDQAPAGDAKTSEIDALVDGAVSKVNAARK